MDTNLELEQIQFKLWRGQATHGCECGGTGAVTINVDSGHVAFGRAFICICKREAYLMRRLREDIEGAGDSIPDDALTLTFEDFKPLPYGAKLIDYADQLMTRGFICEKDDSGAEQVRHGLILQGPTGTGKTVAASILYRELMLRVDQVAWCDAISLVRRVQRTFRDDWRGADGEEIVRRASTAPFLVIDDLGDPKLDDKTSKPKSEASDHHREVIFKLMNYRSAKKLRTVITTNLTRAAFRAYFDARIESRVFGLCASVAMKGRDLRQGVIA